MISTVFLPLVRGSSYTFPTWPKFIFFHVYRGEAEGFLGLYRLRSIKKTITAKLGALHVPAALNSIAG